MRDAQMSEHDLNPFLLYENPRRTEVTRTIQAAVDEEIRRGRTRAEIWQDMADESSRLGQVLSANSSVGAWDTASVEAIDAYVATRLQ